MEFRPCIDIHNGKVKQIVGGSLKDEGNMADENFVSGQDAVFYANLYKKEGFRGGHIILLNARDSEYYEATKKQAVSALQAREVCRLAAALRLKMQKNFLQQEQAMSLSHLMYSVMDRSRWTD